MAHHTQQAVTIPLRAGPRPTTTPRTPHVQLDQFAPAPIQTELWRRMTELPHARTGPSLISAPSSRALHLTANTAAARADAFLVATEFAHLHGDGSGSLHLALPQTIASRALAAGWGESHPAVALGLVHPTVVMLFGPRDERELELIWRLVQVSHAFANGEDQAA